MYRVKGKIPSHIRNHFDNISKSRFSSINILVNIYHFTAWISSILNHTAYSHARNEISKTFQPLFIILQFINTLQHAFVCIFLLFHWHCFGLKDFYPTLPALPTPQLLCLFFFSIVPLDHLFTWQMQVSSIIVVILSIVQTTHNPED